MAESAAPRATGNASTGSSRRLSGSTRTRPCSSSRASRSACFARTRTRRACSSPTPTSCPNGRTWEVFNELDRKGLMMYGQMTAGSWIYIGTQGIVQGTLRDLRRNGPPALWRRPQGPLDPDRRPWRNGRRAAARGGDGRGALHRHRSPGKPDREAARNALSRPPRRRASTRRSRSSATAIGADQRRPARQCRGDPAGNAEARHPARCAHRPDVGARPGQRLLPGGLERRQVAGDARARSRGGRCRGQGVDGEACRGDARLPGDGRSDLRLWQQHPPGSQGHGRDPCLRFPWLRSGLCSPALLPRHRTVPLGGAVGRSRGHLPHRPKGEGADPRRSAPPSLARHGARADRLPGPCRRASAGSAWASATASASRSTRWCGTARSPLRS